jgi:hypothetical protein
MADFRHGNHGRNEFGVSRSGRGGRSGGAHLFPHHARRPYRRSRAHGADRRYRGDRIYGGDGTYRICRGIYRTYWDNRSYRKYRIYRKYRTHGTDRYYRKYRIYRKYWPYW